MVVGDDREIRSTGFNGFPRGGDDDGRLSDESQKYPLICHAEENAIMHAARIGVSLKGSLPPMLLGHPVPDAPDHLSKREYKRSFSRRI